MITYYQCEICGAKSKYKNAILRCENKGVPTPLVKEGDIIYLKDCKETPVLYVEHPSSPITYPIGKLHELKEEMRQFFIGKLYKYKVSKIKIIGHDIKYILMPIEDEYAANFSYTDYAITYTYPTIEGNELMQKVLDLYNKGE